MSKIYPKFKEALLLGLIPDLTGATLKAVLLDTGTYTYSDSHEFLSDLSGVVATSGALTSVTVANGVLDSANSVLTSVSGATVEAVAFYIDTGNSATSRLISFIDGLTLTPDGGNVDLTIGSIANL